MGKLKEIMNFEDFLQEGKVPPLLITGTFDPIHKGYLHDLILKNLKRYEEVVSLVILSHDVNSLKDNRTSIEKRRE